MAVDLKAFREQLIKDPTPVKVAAPDVHAKTATDVAKEVAQQATDAVEKKPIHYFESPVRPFLPVTEEEKSSAEYKEKMAIKKLVDDGNGVY